MGIHAEEDRRRTSRSPRSEVRPVGGALAFFLALPLLSLPLLSLALFGLAGCAGSPGEPEPDVISGPGLSPGTGVRDVPGPDAEPDAQPDAEPDAQPDASPDPGPGPEPDASPDPGPDDLVLCPPTAAPSPLRRLTRREYNYVVEDLLGVTSRPANAFSPEELALGFDNNAAALWVSQVLAEQLIAGAESVSTSVLAAPSGDATLALWDLLPCEVAGLDAAAESDCADTLIDELGLKAFRRPLSLEEREGLKAVFDEVRASDGETFETAVVTVIEALLLSPHFLYRVELGDSGAGQLDDDGDGVVAVSDFEMASRLSFLFWASLPDDELFQKAAAGALSTPAAVQAEAYRLLADPRAARTVGAFHEQWLHLDRLKYAQKDPSVFPTFDEELRGLLAEEARRFVESVALSDDGTYSDLLTSDRSFLNDRLAAHYGIEGAYGPELVEVNGLEHRAGVLTQGALLSVLAKQNQTSPILRGVFVREKLLCEVIAPPPDDVNIQPPDPDPNLSTRERFAAHTEDELCQGCHLAIDPVGFGFEDYDGLGRHRTDENGIPVDNSGEILFTFGDPVSFHGPVELGAALATEDVPSQCYVRQWFRYGYGRAETALDACSLDYLTDQLEESGGRIQDLLVGLTQTAAFRYRAAAPAETTQGVTP